MEENKVIKLLEESPVNNIYSIAPKQYLRRGFEYYREGRLLYFEWSEDYQILKARVKGSALYSVSFFIKKGGLSFKCDCPAWSPFEHCKHVICALVTIRNLLNPNYFNISGQREEYRNSLKSSLFSFAAPVLKEPPAHKSKANKKSPVYSIVAEKNYYSGFLSISVQKDNMQLPPYSTYSIPRELFGMAEKRYDYIVNPAKAFTKYLQRHGNDYPLFLKVKDKKIHVEWDTSLVFSTFTGLNVKGDMVALERLCISNNDVCKEPHLLGDNIIADLKTGKLSLIKDRVGWKPYQLFMSSMMEDRPHSYNNPYNASYGFGREDDDFIKSMPLKVFENCQFNIPDECRGYIQFKVNDEAISSVTARPHYSMTIEEDEQEQGNLILKACSSIEGFRGDTTQSFFNLLKYLGNDHYLSGYLKAKKRRAILIKAFFMLLSVKQKTKAMEIINDALSGDDFYKRKIKSEARQCLTDAFSALNTGSTRVQFCNGKWHLTQNDRDRESLLYIIPYEIFGIDIFQGMRSHNEMSMPADELYRHLPALYLKLKEHNIPLFFKGKPIQTSTWEFSFDCSRESGIDWFEIRPEIRCSGKAIDDNSWQMALKQNGVVEGGDYIQILDSNSQEILKAIAGICRESTAAKGRIKEIVRVPRLQILDWIYLRNMGVKVRLSKEDDDLIERLNRFEKIEERTIPENLAADLRPYQREAYYWLSFLYEHRFGACLADDMGLGKTIQAICLLAGIKEEKVRPSSPANGPHLLVLPPTLLFNWENELRRFYPDLKMHLYTGAERSLEFGECDIVLTTYGLVRRDIQKLKEIQFHVIVFDEAQAVKNIYADTTGAVRQLKGYFKLTMTGTPLENHLGEYYSIIDLSLPGLLGEYNDFMSHIKQDASPHIDLILRRARPFVLRRTKEKILKELPPKIESDIYLELTDKQKVLYKKTVEMVRSRIDEAYHSKTAAQAQIIALTAILKLRQLCVSPMLLDPTIDEPSPKIEFLIGKLRELMDEGHSALVFSQFTSFLNILEKELRRHSLSFCRLDGSTIVGKRKKLVEDFQNGGGASIFLLSLKAGGQGLNLTKASYVFHLDPWWNPAVENQASDRAHRIGQKNKVSIMRILMRHTIEEKMMALKKKKLEIYKTVMECSVSGRKGLSISKTDFDYLLE